MKLSIIIPTHNRVEALEGAITSLLSQKIDCIYEVIVVIDGCSDGTQKMLKDKFPEVRRVLFQENVGAAIGLNAGAKKAKGEILLFLDDDMEYKPLLVQSHIDMHSEAKYDVIIGHFPLGNLPNKSYFRNVIYDWTEGWQKSFSEDVSFYDSLCSGHFSIEKKLYDSVGGFDQDFSRWGRKDSELGYRLIQSGAKFGFCSQAQSFQNYEKLPSRFLADYGMLGRADIEMYHKHPEMKSTLLLSSYYQAPWMVRVLRQYVASDPFVFEILFSFFPQMFDWFHSQSHASPEIEGLLWAAADYFYWKGVKKTIGSSEAFNALVGSPVSILMYHCISSEKAQFSISKETFRAQMEYLKENGYTVLPLASVIDLIKGKECIPEKSVVITFDDASVDFLEAYEVLQEFKYPVTLFVPGYFSENSIPLDYSDGNKINILSADQIKELYSLGVDIQAHGYKHINLGEVSKEEMEQDIKKIKSWLLSLGIESKYFCYPSGSFDVNTKNILKKYGFEAGLTCISTLTSMDSDIFALPRITIEEGDIEDFQFRIRYGIGKPFAKEEFLSQLSSFRAAKWWHSAPAFDKDKIYVYQTRRPKSQT